MKINFYDYLFYWLYKAGSKLNRKNKDVGGTICSIGVSIVILIILILNVFHFSNKNRKFHILEILGAKYNKISFPYNLMFLFLFLFIIVLLFFWMSNTRDRR